MDSIIETMVEAAFSPLDVSERLREYRPELEKNWNEILSQLPEITLRQYRAALQQERDPARHLLFLYFLYCGAIEAEIQARGNTYFHMGLPIGTDRAPLLETIDAGPDDFHCLMRIHKQSLDVVRPIFQNEILPLARRILVYDTNTPGRNWIDYLHILDSIISRKTRKLLSEGQPVTFTHFRFQNLNHYFGLLGEAGASEMIRNIEKTIRERLQEGDMSIILSPHSYIVLSPGREREDVYRRFQDIYFEIKSLILDYSIHTHTVHDPDFSLFTIFRELKI